MKITIDITESVKRVQEFQEYDLGQITTTLQDLLDNSSIVIDSNVIPILKVLTIDNIIKTYLIRNLSETLYNTSDYITGQDLTEDDLIFIVSQEQIDQLSQTGGGGGYGHSVDTAFINKPYTSVMSIIYDNTNPNFEVHLTGNLDLTITDTVNGNSGLVNLYFSGTEVATLNGEVGLSITGKSVMVPIYFVHDGDGLKWYNSVVEDSDNLQLETKTFYLNTLAVGGTINQKDLLAIDEFIVNGKAHGWWEAQKDMCIYLKTNGGINAAIVKLKNYANKPIINYNYLDEEVTNFGIQAPTDTWNTSKYLDLNVSMVDLGIDLQNLSVAIFTPYEGSRDIRFGMGNNNNVLGACLFLFKNSSEIIPFAIAKNNSDTIGSYSTSNQTIGVTVFTGRTDGITSFNNGVNYLDTVPAGSGILEGKFETSRSLYDADEIYYGDVPLSFYSIGTSLTNEQSLYLSKDLYELMDSLGRVAKNGALASFGDSILKGFITPLYKTYAHMVSNTLGLNDLNMSRGERMTSASAGDVLPALDLITQATDFIPLTNSTVMFGLGTNDLLTLDSNSNDFGDSEKLGTYTNYCRAMFEEIIAKPLNLIIVSIGYITEDLVNYSLNKQLDYVKVTAILAKNIYKTAIKKDVHFVNLYHFLMDSDLDYALGVHFNDVGNKAIAEEVIRVVKTGVQRRKPMLDFGTIAANSSVELDVTVLNAELNMAVSTTPPSTLNAGLIVSSFVSADDTVKVRVTNITSSSIVTTEGKYIIDVNTGY